ncbi:glycoside hydrolase family 65 domain-containing protein, partial [mine drainage metagenome]
METHTLDLRAGCYRRSALWQTAAGARIEIHAERLVPLDGRAALALRYRIRSLDYSGSLAVESGIRPAVAAALQGDDPRIGAVLEGGLQWVGGAARRELAWYAQRTTHSGIAVV